MFCTFYLSFLENDKIRIILFENCKILIIFQKERNQIKKE